MSSMVDHLDTKWLWRLDFRWLEKLKLSFEPLIMLLWADYNAAIRFGYFAEFDHLSRQSSETPRGRGISSEVVQLLV